MIYDRVVNNSIFVRGFRSRRSKKKKWTFCFFINYSTLKKPRSIFAGSRPGNVAVTVMVVVVVEPTVPLRFPVYVHDLHVGRQNVVAGGLLLRGRQLVDQRVAVQANGQRGTVLLVDDGLRVTVVLVDDGLRVTVVLVDDVLRVTVVLVDDGLRVTVVLADGRRRSTVVVVLDDGRMRRRRRPTVMVDEGRLRLRPTVVLVLADGRLPLRSGLVGERRSTVVVTVDGHGGRWRVHRHGTHAVIPSAVRPVAGCRRPVMVVQRNRSDGPLKTEKRSLQKKKNAQEFF